MEKQTDDGKRLQNYVGKIEAYAAFSGATGFNVLRIEDDGVYVDFHPNGVSEAAGTFKLSAPPSGQ